MRTLLAIVTVGMLAAGGVARADVVVVPGVRVTVAPPPLRSEIRPAAPSTAHIWIPGHWAWRGGAHVWIGGYWALPPAPGYHWVHARWVNEGGTWVFYEGHWAINQPTSSTYIYEPAPAQEVIVREAPPEPIVEVRPATPFAGAVWIPGYWHWNGYRHVWVGGHWSAPRAGFVWEPHHWVRSPGGWRWAPGHWRRM